jgi:hypothetical protein
VAQSSVSASRVGFGGKSSFIKLGLKEIDTRRARLKFKK